MEKKLESAPADTSAVATPPATATNPSPTPVAAAAPAPAEPATIRVQGILDIDLQRGGNGQLIDVSRG